MLNVRGEKVSESLFLNALKEALSLWPGAQLVDYCCAESGIMGKKFYCTFHEFTSLFPQFLNFYDFFSRRFNWGLRSSLPGLLGAQRCEKPQ